jgi:hypothetical protein
MKDSIISGFASKCLFRVGLTSVAITCCCDDFHVSLDKFYSIFEARVLSDYAMLSRSIAYLRFVSIFDTINNIQEIHGYLRKVFFVCSLISFVIGTF